MSWLSWTNNRFLNLFTDNITLSPPSNISFYPKTRKTPRYTPEQRAKNKAKLFYKLSRKYPNGIRYFNGKTGKYEIWGEL